MTKQDSKHLAPPPPPATRRRRYRTPVLVYFGDIRSLTLGGSPGTGDSGNPATEDPIPFGRYHIP